MRFYKKRRHCQYAIVNEQILMTLGQFWKHFSKFSCKKLEFCKKSTIDNFTKTFVCSGYVCYGSVPMFLICHVFRKNKKKGGSDYRTG